MQGSYHGFNEASKTAIGAMLKRDEVYFRPDVIRVTWVSGACAALWGHKVTAFEQRLVRFTKIAVIIAATWTGLSAAMLVSAQLIFWLQNKEWDAYPISSVIADRRDITYTVASSRELNKDQIYDNQIVDWVLHVPAIVPLLIAFVCLVAFWMRLSEIEKRGFTP